MQTSAQSKKCFCFEDGLESILLTRLSGTYSALVVRASIVTVSPLCTSETVGERQSQTSKQRPSRVLGIHRVVRLYLRGPHKCLRGLFGHSDLAHRR